MLERMRDFSKSPIMKGLLGLVALSFVAYFGSAPFQKAKQEEQKSAVTVNGNRISSREFLRLYNQMRDQMRERQGGGDLDEEQQVEIVEATLNALIDQSLLEQWCQEVGLQVTDQEVAQEIENLLTRITRGGTITQSVYYNLLYQMGYPSPRAFEETVRRQMLVEKASNIVSENARVSDAEVLDVYQRQGRKAKVSAVAFKPEDYKDEVKPERSFLQQYYDKHKESYHQPNRVQIDYVQVFPSQHEAEVMIVESVLEQYFNSNKDKYKIDAKMAADYLYFDPQKLQQTIEPTDEEIAAVYNKNPENYQMPERVKIRYLPIPLWSPDADNAPSESQLRQAYLSWEDDFLQLEASQIFLPVANDAKELEDARVLKEAERIVGEIKEGLDFAEAARRYSKDSSAQQGGSLGFIRRNQMPRDLDKALFSLGIGQVSEPVRGGSGYHIFKAHGKHVPPLEEIRAKVLRKYAEDRLKKIRESLADKPLPVRLAQGLKVFETGFVERGEPIDDRIGSDFRAVSNIAFRLKDHELSSVIYGVRNLYLVYRVETEEPRMKTLEEARDDIIASLREQKARDAAAEVAQEALQKLRAGEADFAAVAKEYGIEVQDTGFFSYQEPPKGFGQGVYSVVSTVAQLQPGGISEVVMTENGPYIFMSKGGQPARLPELSEVRAEVEKDYRRENSYTIAQDIAYKYLDQAVRQELSLRKLATVEEGLVVKDSGLFAKDEPIPGVADDNNQLHSAAFSIKQIGEVFNDVVEVTDRSGQQVMAYYVIELKDRVPAHIPPLDDVQEQVTDDYVYEQATGIAATKAADFHRVLESAKVQAGTGEIDLKNVAEQNDLKVIDTPFFSEMGYIPGIPGAQDTPAFSRTALGLDVGQCSDLIQVREQIGEMTDLEQEPEYRTSGYYYIQVLEKQEPDMTKFEEARESLKERLLNARQRQGFLSWKQELRANAEIERNEKFLAPFLGKAVPEEEASAQEGAAAEGEATS